MNDESAADRQAAQQAREQEKKWGDSATAVSPDTQRADPDRGASGSTFGGEATRGESTVFNESHRTPDGLRDPDTEDRRRDADADEHDDELAGTAAMDESRARAAADDEK